MHTRPRARIVGTGMFVPPDVYTNIDLEKMMDTSDEWIQQRTGIKERRFAKPGIGPSDLALEASRAALTMAGVKATDLDLIVFATLSPDYFFPGSGAFLQDYLGAGPVLALDVRGQCSGYIYGLKVASAFIESGQARRVLLVGAECHSRGISLTTKGRDVAVLFGDGAGATVLVPEANPELGVLSVEAHTDGAHREVLKLETPSFRQWPAITKENLDEGLQFPQMDGRNVYKHAVTRMPEVVNSVLEKHSLSPDDVKLYLFHQANMRIYEAVMKQLGQPLSKTHNNIERYGNCSAASVPMCLDEAVRAGRLERGDLLCMTAFGAGFTWGSALVRW